MIDSGKVEITQGENAAFTIELWDEYNRPFDLTEFTKFKVTLPKSEGCLEVTEEANANGSVVALDDVAKLGRLEVQIKAADTAELLADERLNVGLELNNAIPDPRRKVFENVLTVVAFNCA